MDPQALKIQQSAFESASLPFLPPHLSTSQTALNFYKILGNKCSVAFENFQTVNLFQPSHGTDEEIEPQNLVKGP